MPPSTNAQDDKPVLADEFNRKVRPCIDAIDDLRQYGLEKDVALPAVVVIGDQSVGKSSVLEAMSGVQLPRGTGIVTRCPLELRMKQCDPGNFHAKISYDIQGGHQPLEKTITDPSNIDFEIRQAQRALVGDSGGVSDRLIRLEVQADYVPDLTLIDLPGIVRYSEGSDTIVEETKNLIKTYVSRPETIILVVIPCNVDIDTVEACNLAKQVDPNGDRTIGVLTRPDLIDHGVGPIKEVLDILENKKMKLKKGFYVVKCRSQKRIEEGQSLEQALAEEVQFFRSDERFRVINPSQCGVKQLSSKLTNELFLHIKNCVPMLLEDINAKLLATNHEIEFLGGLGLPEGANLRVRYLIQLLDEYCDKVHRVSIGDYRHHNKKIRLFSKVRELTDKFATDIEERTPTDQDASFLDNIKTEIQAQRGNELPTFTNTYPVCERLILEYISLYKRPAMECLLSVNGEVEIILRELAQDIFRDFPFLESKVKEVTDRLRNKAYKDCERNVYRQFDMENIVWTQDRIFKEEMFDGGKKDASSKVPPTSSRATEGKGSKSEKDRMKSIDDTELSSEAQKVVLGVQAYMQIASRRIMDMIPLNIMLHFLHGLSNETKKEVLALSTCPDDLDHLLEEDQNVKEKRETLKRKIERLEFAAAALAKI
ncbi:unnamed protein product [Owenia fusiformis]|uniref:Uncharacterized protein n=1 Tax=Owenia fusiformis TaxID=6347 RepID=A0A8J1TLA5_OWEFU|nr:unnamed protein product [Owenia fusiformis]